MRPVQPRSTCRAFVPTMQESSLETVVPERDFARALPEIAGAFAYRVRALLAARHTRWAKRDFFQLDADADELEAVLDDYGARYNRTFCGLTELTASIRGFSLAGLSLAHLVKRLDGYQVLEALPADDREAARDAIGGARNAVQEHLVKLLQAWWDETVMLGLLLEAEVPSVDGPALEPQRFRLPRNVDQEELVDEQQRIAEVASKYLQACVMLDETGLRRTADPVARRELLTLRCSEELARVYEATIHNLQSAYDTYVGNTRLEGDDPRLRRLRGFISSALHLFEATTQLVHFIERHESGVRPEHRRARLEPVVPRAEVEELILETLLHWALRFIDLGRPIAEELVPTYTDLRELVLELQDGIVFHARPASLVVGIVNHYGTPVEMEVGGRTCNAGSILELLVLVGTHSGERRFVFRGDARPLEDIACLFEHALGERGISSLPAELDYLRS